MSKRYPAAALLLATALISPSLVAADNSKNSDENDYTNNSEKHVEDPTRIITRASLGYDNEGSLSFSGSVGLDDKRMISARTDAALENWSIGGSWLFPKGIVNFNLNSDVGRTSYNVGTYLPLKKLVDVNTGKWMLFPNAGFSVVDMDHADELSFGGYMGMFGIRPVTDKVSVVSFVSGSLASGDYQSGSLGAGTSYRFNKQSSLRLMGFYSKDSTRTKQKLSASYSYQF